MKEKEKNEEREGIEREGRGRKQGIIRERKERW